MKDNPKNHSFDCKLIQVALAIKLQTSAGFRAIQKILSIYILYLGLSMKPPSYSTILLWLKKTGYYQLEREKAKANDWVIILDESIEFGHDKLLAIYGVRHKNIDFNKALGYKDLVAFSIISSGKWTGELIAKEIQNIERGNGKIIYAVADGGNAIKKALRLEKIPHVYDITHKFAWFLKEIYKPGEDFQSYIKTMAKMRGKLSLSNVSHVLPPNQRFHSRYMNLDIISDWGMKVINYLGTGKINDRAYKELKWVKKYWRLINELAEVNMVLSEIKALLKTRGLSLRNINKAKKILENMKIDSVRTKRLKTYISDFLSGQIALIPKKNKIVCTSDIIESAFGKYKNYISNNPMVGITNLALSMAAFTSELNIDEIKLTFENVKIKDLKSWSKTNIGETNLQRRMSILKKAG